MDYLVLGIPFTDELYHHGIKGQKWGIRRYQNPDGSLTAEGKAKYGTVENFQSEMARKKERRDAFKTSVKQRYDRYQENSIKRGKKLSEAGYKKRFNVGHALIATFGNAWATTAVSSALNAAGATKSAKVVDAIGNLNGLGIWATTAKNMYDYENYRNSKRLSKGVR